MRLFTTVSLVTCAALANCASVAALSPISQSNTMLCATSGQTSGAPLSSRRRQVGDRRQDVVIHLDRLRGVARGLGGVGDDERHRIADMAHHAVRQHRMRRHRLVEPSRFCTGAAQGSAPMPSAFRSAAV